MTIPYQLVSTNLRRTVLLTATIVAPLLGVTTGCGDDSSESQSTPSQSGGSGGSSTAGQAGQAGVSGSPNSQGGSSGNSTGGSGTGGTIGGTGGSSGGSGSSGTGGNIGGTGGSTAGTGGQAGTGGSLLSNGTDCTSADQCASGFCADGVCCETACDSPCMACTSGLTGQIGGVCVNVPLGTDPHGDCTDTSNPCVANSCDGEGSCSLIADGTVCRAAVGACDIEEQCIAGQCPEDQLAPAESLCRPSAGDCDTAEACNGVSPDCPADVFVIAGAECRWAVDACDATEYCTGDSADCPTDQMQPAGTECGAFLCTGNETTCPTSCSGDSDCASDAHCVASICTALKWAFTTSTTHNGNFGGIAGADQICQNLATTANLTGVYKAWMSDNSTSPSVSFSHPQVPYYLPNGVKIANNYNDLTDGTIMLPIDVTETGQSVPPNIPFTGTTYSGTSIIGLNCNGWTSGNPGVSGVYGETTTSEYWSYSGSGACSVLHRIYCFEQ